MFVYQERNLCGRSVVCQNAIARLISLIMLGQKKGSLVFKSVAMPKTKQILSVCGLHFTRDDFANGLKAELMGFKGRLVLKPTAVPSLLAKSGSESGIKEQQKKIVDKAMGIAPKSSSKC